MKISIIAFDDCMTSAVYGVFDAFHLATRIASTGGTSSWCSPRLQITTPTGSAVQGYGGHRIDARAPLEDARHSDVLVVAPIRADIEAALERQRPLVAWLSTFRPTLTSLVASTCTGAFLLAEAGLLKGRRATTNPRFRDLFAARYPTIALELDERVLDDGAVICAGSTSAQLRRRLVTHRPPRYARAASGAL